MPRYLKFILTLALKQRKSVIFLAVLTVISVAARLTEPYLYKIVVDTLTNGLVANRFAAEQVSTLFWVVGIWFVLAVIMNVTTAQANYLVWFLGNRGSHLVHMTGYRRLLRLDYSRHVGEHSSALAKIVDDADGSTWIMTQWWFSRFASAILGFVAMLVIAFSVSWQMTLIAVSVIPPALWFIVSRISKYEAEQKRINKLWEEKHEHLHDQISNIVTYKLNPHENIYLERHDKFCERASMAQLAQNKKWRLVEMMNPDAIARFLVLGTGIFFVSNGSITLGTLFMFMGLLNEILTPLHLLGDILPEYSRRSQHIEKLLDLMEEKDNMGEPEIPVEASDVKGGVAFNRVSYSYAKDGTGFSLQDIDFSILPGQTVALVGHSGSGKTTVMSLLTRLVDPTGGSITIDGTDIRDFAPERLKLFIGTVLQENAMYNESVAENIAYGNPTATREEIVGAAKQAFAHEFIEKLPQGYDTLIGERGVRLSGGEKQRIAIARAILKNPKIVVLDEPTSAMDSITEMQVQKGLNELMKERTTLVIAHRLSTVRDADRIVVLGGGRVIGSGTHEELMRDCPTYRTMVELQVKGFLAET